MNQANQSNESAVYVSLEFTPNPNTLKYSVNRELLDKGAVNFIKKEDAEKLVGKTVTWTSTSGKKISGIITKAHGNSGAVLVRFDDKGLPGQSLGTKVDIQ